MESRPLVCPWHSKFINKEIKEHIMVGFYAFLFFKMYVRQDFLYCIAYYTAIYFNFPTFLWLMDFVLSGLHTRVLHTCMWLIWLLSLPRLVVMIVWYEVLYIMNLWCMIWYDLMWYDMTWHDKIYHSSFFHRMWSYATKCRLANGSVSLRQL